MRCKYNQINHARFGLRNTCSMQVFHVNWWQSDCCNLSKPIVELSWPRVKHHSLYGTRKSTEKIIIYKHWHLRTNILNLSLIWVPLKLAITHSEKCVTRFVQLCLRAHAFQRLGEMSVKKHILDRCTYPRVLVKIVRVLWVMYPSTTNALIDSTCAPYVSADICIYRIKKRIVFFVIHTPWTSFACLKVRSFRSDSK